MRPATKTPESSGATVIYQEFGVPVHQPLHGAEDIEDFVRGLEADSEMSGRLASARQALLAALGESSAYMRELRLRAGLSQAALAGKAGATQSYIARVEAGTVDPGTDMIARLAAALGVPPDVVFVAVRRQREGSQ